MKIKIILTGKDEINYIEKFIKDNIFNQNDLTNVTVKTFKFNKNETVLQLEADLIK